MPEMDIMTDTFPIDFSMSLLQKESSLHKTAQMVGLRGLITGIISLIEWKGKARITFDNLNDLLDSRDKAVKALTAQNSDFEKEKSALESIITVLDDKAIAMEKLILETFGDEEGLVHLKAVYAEMDLDFETIMLEDKVPDCVN
jgi:HEAT repeat protein